MPTLAVLRSRLDAFRTRAADLAAALRRTADTLAEGRLPPDGDFGPSLAALRTDLDTLRAEATAAAGAEGVALAGDAPTSAAAVEDLLATLERHHRDRAAQRQRRAQDLLNRAATLAHRHLADFQPLAAWRTHLEELRQGLEADAEGTAALLEGRHPAAELVGLVERWGRLSPAELFPLMQRLPAALDAELLAAAFQGLLELRATSAPAPEPPPAPDPAPLTPAPLPPPVTVEAPPPPPEPAPTPPAAPEPAPELPEALVEDDGEPPQEWAPAPPRAAAPATPPALEGTGYHDEFTPEETAQAIARRYKEGAISREDVALRALVWRLIHEDRLGLAYHLAEILRQRHPDLKPQLPPWALRAVALAGCVRHAAGEVARRLTDEFAAFGAAVFSDTSEEWNRALRFLLAAATLRPAVLAPATGAGRVLRELHLGAFPQTWEFCQEVARFAEARQPLDLQVLKHTHDQAGWQARADQQRQRLEAWYEGVQHKHLKYDTATEIWNKWLRPGGYVHQLLESPRRTDLDRIDPARRQDLYRRTQEAVTLLDEAWVRRQVDRDDPRVSRRKSARIVGAPFNQLARLTEEARTFAQQWLDLEQTRPARPNDFVLREAGRLRARLADLRPGVEQELETLLAGGLALPVRAGLSRCRAAVKDVCGLFDPAGELATEDGCLRRTLHGDLLRVPAVPLSEAWEPEGLGPDTLARVLIDAVANGLPDWETAFADRAALGDHVGTAQLLRYRAAQAAPADLEAWQGRRQRDLEERRVALRADLDDTRRKVEEAVAFGQVPEQERTDCLSVLRAVELELPELLRFQAAHDRLEQVRQNLSRLRGTEVERVRQQVRAQAIGPEHPAFARIDRLLDQGDVFTASEYVQMVKDGHELPPLAEPPDPLRAFFPAGAEALDRLLADTAPPALVQAFRRREGLPGLPLAELPEGRAAQAAEMLEAWFTAAKKRRVTEEQIRRILTGLGFTPTRIPPLEEKDGRTWGQVEAAPLRDRQLCPVPQFGSDARGRYRLLCVWDGPEPEDLIARVGDTAHTAPTLAFHFGRLDVARRRQLARLRLEARRTLLVVDTVLLTWLAAAPGPRLPAVFACGLPFTFLDAYPITPGLVPPEMFYGRRAERASVLDPNGSCFIYGGRQLGKTALLRDAERTFAAEPGHVALWLDLKAARVGLDRELWPLLAEEFKRQGVLPDNLSPTIGPDKLIERIADWIKEKDQRRILLLLDEADKFLEADAKVREGGRGAEFPRVAKLKELMETTKRRFKVVFAGLHNVQRTVRLSNHPLAHFGEPICIGPLLTGGEWREARALVERPLAALGYRFESPDLVTRILSQTNYFPSLIQLYGHHLLRHVTDPNRAAFDPRTSPPYLITARHVEEAYQREDLRKAIRDRFMWTLQLDERYEVIAHAIARTAAPEAGDGRPADPRLVHGFTVDAIRREVQAWWPEGFAEAGEDALRGLLEEMVGLGVLRQVDGRFTLRSPNVVLLMGSLEEIEHTLLRHREPPAVYEPTHFRAAYMAGTAVHPERRHPLTAAQEADLRRQVNGASALFGTAAAGRGDLIDFLTVSFGKEFVAVLPAAATPAAFVRALADLAERRKKDGLTLGLIPPDRRWDWEWVEAGLKQAERLKSPTKFLRLLFVADPERTADLLTDGAARLETLRGAGLTVFSLGPWHDAALRPWLEDLGYGPRDREGRQQITAATGNWPGLLAQWRDRGQADHRPWADLLAEWDQQWNLRPWVEGVARDLGLDVPAWRPVLAVVARYPGATTAEVAELLHADGAAWTEARVAAALAGAELLHLARAGERGWELDRVAARALQALGG